MRTRDELEHLVQADPFGGYRLDAGRKRVVSFSRNALPVPSKLPLERGSARIHGVHGREAYTSYVAGAEGPVFMELIADTFGLEVTTRTWDTILKCLKASA